MFTMDANFAVISHFLVSDSWLLSPRKSQITTPNSPPWNPIRRLLLPAHLGIRPTFFLFLLFAYFFPLPCRLRRLCLPCNPRVLNFPPDFRFFPLFPISFIPPSSCFWGIRVVVDFFLFFWLLNLDVNLFILFLWVDGWFVISLDLVVCVYIGGVDWFLPRCAGVKCGDTLRLGAGAFF